MPSFTYVHIPADPDTPLRELQLEIPPEQDVQCLLDDIKRQLNSIYPQSAKQASDVRRQAMMQNVPKGTVIPDDLLAAAGTVQLVESVPLLGNSKANNFVGVNMYVDDTGALKQLPVNMRASEICRCCGRLVQVHGDAWIARIFDNEDEFKRLDFKLAEVSSSAAWVRAAHAQYQEKQRAEVAEVALQRLQARRTPAGGALPPPPRMQELSPAEAAKEEGNSAFRKGDWRGAVDAYTRALQLDGGLHAARNNRAMAFLRLGEWRKAVDDCDRVLESDGKNVKALLRMAEGLRQLREVASARTACNAVLKMEPHNAQARDILASLPADATAP